MKYDPRIIDDEWIEAYLDGEVCLPSHGWFRHMKCWIKRTLWKVVFLRYTAFCWFPFHNF